MAAIKEINYPATHASFKLRSALRWCWCLSGAGCLSGVSGVGDGSGGNDGGGGSGGGGGGGGGSGGGTPLAVAHIYFITAHSLPPRHG